MSNIVNNNPNKKIQVAAPFQFTIKANYINFERKLVIDQCLKPINPLQCGRQQCPNSYSYGPLTKDFWILHFVISGKGVIKKHNTKKSVDTNEVFIIRPLETVSYTADAEDPWEYIWIGFTADVEMPELLLKNDVIKAEYLKDLFKSAFDNENFKNIDTYGAYEHYLCGLIWQMLGLIKSNSPHNMTITDSYIKPAITIMTMYYAYDITVAEIAKRLHISTEHFSRIFKSEMGISPKKYLNDLRMKKAAKRLMQKEFNVSDTARLVGYPDVFAFSRAFKAYYGFSPSELIKRSHNPSS